MMEIISETEGCFLEKINKTGKLQAKLTKRKNDQYQEWEVRDHYRHTNVKRITNNRTILCTQAKYFRWNGQIPQKKKKVFTKSHSQVETDNLTHPISNKEIEFII